MIKNITIVSCHSREGGNLDTCFRRYDTKFVSPNSIGFTIPAFAGMTQNIVGNCKLLTVSRVLNNAKVCRYLC
ncbi:hypothetical protein [Candidatus Tisiphia endosymbiont of Hybos culiciformis]|uniref:hypothetical protein n=1 Tax=Candidatus Tisiphia endosymbiont of Hybos culiciformis TaxID=3139331 RepID=UPI003CCA91BA